MQIAPNCTRILADYGLLDEAKRLGVVPERMVMKDAVDTSELTSLDLADVERVYDFPYMVIHRSDLHTIFLRACERAGVELVTGQTAVHFENSDRGARVTFEDGHVEEAGVVIAADGLHRWPGLLVDDQPVNSAYVAYRGAVPIDRVREHDIAEKDVVVYVGPQCHFVQYPLRGGETFNQVAVFESPKALAGEDDWGTPTTRRGLRRHLRAGPAGLAADVARQVVADVRPGPDHGLGARSDRAARRRRSPAAAIHGAGRDHGDRGRVGAR